MNVERIVSDRHAKREGAGGTEYLTKWVGLNYDEARRAKPNQPVPPTSLLSRPKPTRTPPFPSFAPGLCPSRTLHAAGPPRATAREERAR